MPRSSLLLTAFGLALLGLISAPATAQNCASPTDNFWKTDSLPQVPSGNPTGVSIIQGLCEGEAAGMAFYLSPGQPTQKINKVAVGFGDAAGAGGFNATVNIEIYDGITWNAGIPTLGPKVFDLNNDLGASMQVISFGINEYDLSAQNIIVGGSGSYVIAFRSNINPNGSCAGGFTANFFTDFNGIGGCTTVPQSSLIDIQGQGWRDGSTATVSGFPLCPFFFNGNWVIRACTEDVGGMVTCQTNLGLGGPGTLEFSVCGGDLSTGTTADLLLTGAPPFALGFFLGSTQFNPQFSGKVFGVLAPLPIQFLQTLPTNGLGEINLPGVIPGGGGPVSFYMQWVVEDPSQIKGFAVSNVIRADFQP